jgi:PAS domain S-box-containing protein
MAWENNDSLFRRIVDSSPEAIVFSDRDGIIRIWNGGAEAIFGYGAREAVGESLDIIVPEKMRERHWEGYFRVMKTGATKYGKDLLSVPGIRKDGSRVSLEFSVALIRDGEGALMGISAVMRDVTARWQKEREMKERIAALEAKAKGSGNPS